MRAWSLVVVDINETADYTDYTKGTRMKVKDIAERIESACGGLSLELALSWDNVGLLVGNPDKEVKKILLTIDITAEVLAEARRQKTDLIISYHPVIWDGLKKITAESIVYKLIRSDIAVFSIHTALDIVRGGVNDALAEIVGIEESKPIGGFVDDPSGGLYKFVVFVPVDSVKKVSDAVFAAGAGCIGNYSCCGFGAEGVGTFLPMDGARPAIGRKEKFEKVKEVRFETIVPAEKLEAVVAAMKKTHPYEVPAFDCIKLSNPADKLGLGRIGRLSKPAELGKIIEKVKKATGAKSIGIVGKEKRLVTKAAVCAGACGKLIFDVIAAKADLYVTGELKHHQALAAQEAGLTCLCLSHTVSERFVLKKVAKKLQEKMPRIKFRISKEDKDPFRWKEI
jgi:dinuclear metal center YbgI/SA1388 family protein